MKVLSRGFILILVFLLTQLIYLHTLNPAFPNDDSAETITAGVTLGLQHPPGYALAALTGRLHSFFPLGGFGFRAGWGASLWASLGAMLLTLIIFELLQTPLIFSDPLPEWISLFCALLGGLGLAFSPTYWQNALSAKGGIYQLSLFLQLAVLACLVRSAQKTGGVSPRFFFLTLFSTGLGLANHWETIIVFVPAIFLFFVSVGEIQWRAWIRGVPLFLLGISPLLYLPLRAHLNPALNLGEPDTLSYFKADFFRSYYSYREGSVLQILGNSLSGISTGHPIELFAWQTVQQILLIAGHWQTDFGLFFTFFSLTGLWRWRMGKEKEVLRFLILSSLLILGALFSFTSMPNAWAGAKFLLSFHWMMFLWVSLGAAWILTTLRARSPGFCRFGAILMAVYLVFTLILHFQTEDQNHEILVYDYGQNLLKSLPRNSLFFAEADEDYFSLYYLQQVERRRPDVVMIPAFTLFEPWGTRKVEREEPGLGLTASAVSFPDHFARIIYASSEIVVKNRELRPIGFSRFDGAFHRYYLNRQKNLPIRPSGLVWLLDRPATRTAGDLSPGQLRIRDVEDLLIQKEGPLEGLRRIYTSLASVHPVGEEK